MPTELLFRDDAYEPGCEARVLAAGPEGVVLDRTVFYPRAGGQPGDTGTLRWPGGSLAVADTLKGPDDTVLHLPDGGPGDGALPPPGTMVEAVLDWPRRHRLMRMHTALHLLCSLLPGVGVTGGQIGTEKSRLDFDLAGAALPEKEALAAAINALVAADHPVTEGWISEAELDANPGLVRTLSVQPPRGAGRIRLVRIGDGMPPVDLQPCGGTHVRATGEIGPVTIGKIESKGKANRRVHLALAD
ncbi:alanyl-tRNA editing protein [Roseomonas sp. NAR14]|uniref:Alanine--tRNA ligase n=1 Tax=Roseomonas acroporae TaxID=2937791 RepID=A0A9X2BVN9_9PROT|nr:alanyl-tRNA editing protein [Roseomonas acroporae]MCK8785246.1 alanyl-tRNA editing protein [Roseomonas acroporae]